MNTRDGNCVIGIIFPIFRNHFQRFIYDKKTIFVKFVARPFNRLRSGSRLFFYESKGNKQIVGEARIVEMDSRKPEEVFTRFEKNLFLTCAEFEEYTRERKTREMLVLVVADAKKYAIPLTLNKSVTMAGQYMTKQMYHALRA